jgi:ubiquinone/menaquinone biosynthesis C-methylase UbiE
MIERVDKPMSLIDSTSAHKHYAANARRYDLLMRPFARIRAQAIAHLHVQSNDIVLELGCGTGTSFPLLVPAIGPNGHLIGIDRSPDMLAYARQKILRASWQNISLIQANAEDVALMPESVDAVLTFYTNDIITSHRAVDHAVQALRPEGRFVIAGVKLTQGVRGIVLNPITHGYARRSITTPVTDQPWRELEQRIGPLTIEEHLGGSAFIAYGTKWRVTA